MIGIDLRSTMDMDTTIQGIPVTEDVIRKVITEICQVNLNDSVVFELCTIKPIHELGAYEDFRVGLQASLLGMRIHLKVDITTGDVITPKEIVYNFPLMFENRSIYIKAYNVNTVLAEKIESILARNISNTRARDYYDVYMLTHIANIRINMQDVIWALKVKANERGTTAYLNNYKKYLSDIKASQELANIWQMYSNQYSYAQGIDFQDILQCLEKIMSYLEI